MNKIVPYIDDELYDLVPRPTKEQRKALKKSIEDEGQKEPIIVDQTGKIMDGNTRYEICEELGREVKFIIRDFKDNEEKKNYAITVNLKRRHLTNFQIYELFEKQIDMIKKFNLTERNRNIWKTRRGEKQKNTYDQKVENSSVKKAGELTGLTEAVLNHCLYIKKHGNEKLINDVREGKITSNRAYERLRKVTSININKGRVYRSRLGIVCDIIKTIKEAVEDVRISRIAQKANISYDLAKEIVNDLINDNILEFKKVNIRGKYFATESTSKFYMVTPKGNQIYSKILEIYQLLPESIKGIKIDSR